LDSSIENSDISIEGSVQSDDSTASNGYMVGSQKNINHTRETLNHELNKYFNEKIILMKKIK